jgi:hypothetical protein
MGTNFYLKKRLSQKKKDELIKYIQTDLYDKIVDELPKSIHIGKRSYGWKFLWDANEFKYFKPTKESLERFLKSGLIFDEYGQQFSYEEFIENEVGKSLDQGYDYENYHKDHPEEIDSFWAYRKYTIEHFRHQFGLDVNDFGEFYIGKHRFTVLTDFG